MSPCSTASQNQHLSQPSNKVDPRGEMQGIIVDFEHLEIFEAKAFVAQDALPQLRDSSVSSTPGPTSSILKYV
jgi:hypothetical protein